jgi:uncharacterized membrane protein YphA (DoxX/SURF4 family)
MDKLRIFSSPLLRLGLAFVFLWFGVSQIINPSAWIAYIPDWVVNNSPVDSTILIYLNAGFEIIFGSALFLGFFTRFVAFFLLLHIANITFTLGFDAIAVRDFGLTVAMIVVYFNGDDFLTLDKFMHQTYQS